MTPNPILAWAGSIPETWIRKKLKIIGHVSAGGVNKKVEDEQKPVRSIHYLDVYRNSGKHLLDSDEYLLVSATDGQFETCSLRQGDVLFTSSSETPDDIGHCVTIGEDLSDVLYGYHLTRFRSDAFNWRYSNYYFGSHIVRSFFASVTNGITRYGLNYDDFTELMAIIPPLQTQMKIAEYLDRKTTEIDSLIADKQRMIELLQERRQALITEAVTKGLDRNVPMKYSGVEWIGEIPEGWEVKRLKFCISRIKTGSTPSTSDEEYFDGEINWYTPGDFSETLLLNTSRRKLHDKAVDDGIITLFDPDTLAIIGIGATMGRVNYIQEQGYCNQQITVVETSHSVIPKYLLYWFHSHLQYIRSMANFTTLPILNNEVLKGILCLFPTDLLVQRQIIDYLDTVMTDTENSIKAIGETIDALRALRQSLITEAVTGKLNLHEGMTHE